jgi:selenophosphate synthase
MTTPLGSDVEPDVYCKNATFCRACDSSSTRCWITRSDAADANGAQITLPAGFSDIDTALLHDPQTSGGLLVSCSEDAVDEVLAIFAQHGFARAGVVGEITAGAAGLVVTADASSH